MTRRQRIAVTPDWLRPAAVCAVVALHAAVLLGIPSPAARQPVVTAPLAVVVVQQVDPTPSMAMPDPAEAVEVRPPSAAAVDSLPAESETVEKVDPSEQARERPVEVAEAKPVEAAAARAPDRVALAVTPPTPAERIDRKEQHEARPEQRPTPDASEVKAIDAPAQPTRSPEAPAVHTLQSARLAPMSLAPMSLAPMSLAPMPLAPMPLMRFNPAAEAVASDVQEAKPPAAEAASSATPVPTESTPVKPEPQTAPVAARTGPVQQAMRTEPNEAMVRDRPDRGDPTIANDKKPAKEKEEKKKPKVRSVSRAAASTAASASSPSSPSAVASVSGSAASANYRSVVMAELNRRKLYPPGARELRGVVFVTFAVGSSGNVTSFHISRSSGVGALDGAVLQMMRSVSLPPPPGGSFRATAPIHFDLQR